jgi:hypothetical protein
MRIPALAAAAVLTFGLVACGNNTAPTTEAPTAETGGQASPDAAGQVFLRAFGNTDARGACAVMASGKTVIGNNQTALDACANVLQGTMDPLKDSLAGLKEATVSGATETGDTASFETADVQPALGKEVLGSFKAVKIDDTWYVSQ